MIEDRRFLEMRQMARVIFFIFAVLFFILPLSAGNTISAQINSPAVASPGDIISIQIIVTNLASVILDHCNYGFSAGPYVDLAQPVFRTLASGGPDSVSFYDSLARPPAYGTSSFFDEPLLLKIREDAPFNSVIVSSFWVETIAEVGPDGEWCPGCWADSASATSSTLIQPGPVSVPEFPGIVFPGAFLAGFAVVMILGKKRD